MNKQSIWAVIAGVLVTIVVTTIVDILLHVTGVFPGADQPLAVLALPQCWLGGKIYEKRSAAIPTHAA